jgi:hypothetical protein
MKTDITTFIGAIILIVTPAIGLAIVRPALAQVAATSSNSTVASPTATKTIASSTPNQALSTPPVENTSTSTTPVQTGAAATTTTASSSAGASPLKLGVGAGIMPAVPGGSVIGMRHRDWNIVRSGIAKGLRHYELVYGANKETVRLEAMTVAGMGDPIRKHAAQRRATAAIPENATGTSGPLRVDIHFSPADADRNGPSSHRRLPCRRRR